MMILHVRNDIAEQEYLMFEISYAFTGYIVKMREIYNHQYHWYQTYVINMFYDLSKSSKTYILTNGTNYQRILLRTCVFV